MDYQQGDTITSGGVVYTFDGISWSYVQDNPAGGVSTTITVSKPPTPDAITRIVNDKVVYDFNVLAGLAVGALYANTVQAG